MPSLLDIVVSFLAALLSAAFLHFGAAEKPEAPRSAEPQRETTSLSLTETPEPDTAPAAVTTQTPNTLPTLKFLAH